VNHGRTVTYEFPKLMEPFEGNSHDLVMNAWFRGSQNSDWVKVYEVRRLPAQSITR
jgi:hypothetical protein